MALFSYWRIIMNTYKYTFGRFGIDENNYLTDIENGTHCLGYIMNRDTGEESENQTELKLPEDIDGFSIDLPNGSIWLKKGYDRFPFGRVYIKYYDASNIDENKLFNPLITNALAGDKDAAVALVMKLAQPFYTLKEITASNIKNVTYGTLCVLITDFTNDLCLKFKFAQSGAFSGNSECMNLLGYYYESGRGVEENQKLAFKWYKKAAKNGNRESMERLAQFYSWNTNACVINPYKSFYWAEKASQNGYIWEWQRIGFAYLYGDATGKNYKKAIYWFKKICNLPKDLRINCTNKYGEILYCLGFFSFYGIGTKKDLHLAFDYFSQSADEGYYLACEALAYF